MYEYTHKTTNNLMMVLLSRHLTNIPGSTVVLHVKRNERIYHYTSINAHKCSNFHIKISDGGIFKPKNLRTKSTIAIKTAPPNVGPPALIFVRHTHACVVIN